ncbi:hypothetical protein H0A64_09840 [Alcaligenaceae bacterium]|nr:hypothetical protein [Alcaligenaceae bacterium]
MNLRTLSDGEFLRYANSQMDDLTSSDIERELLRRLEAIDTDLLLAIDDTKFTPTQLVDLNEAMGSLDFVNTIKLLNHINDSAIDTGDVLAFIKLIEGSDITESDELKEALEFATKFQAIANDAGDVFTRLTTLITETQED